MGGSVTGKGGGSAPKPDTSGMSASQRSWHEYSSGGGGGGSSGGGKPRDGLFGWLLNPVRMITGSAKAGGNFTPMLSIMEQGVNNTVDVMQGKTGIGQHQNFFGAGATGELLESVLTDKPLKDPVGNIPYGSSLLDDE